ncbi:MAG: phospho-N-acetylmuramoyl-pentapeptide-transferase [Bacteroidia bacterium]|nr:phospho-N-acetylmuramoyl-pentapeptide-transferase [Bacteroidia bacterium]
MVTHPDFKGEKGALFPDNSIRPGENLLEAGFVFGDRLIGMNGADTLAIPSPENYASAASYKVERGKVPGHRKVLEVTIPAENREAVALAMFETQDQHFATRTNIPFLKSFAINYSKIAFWEEDGGWAGKIIYILIVIFIVTAVSNAVNLTDGIDGLAAGTSAITGVSLAIFCYVSGNIIFADYLNIFYIPQSAELVIFCAALVGGCVGFLWYNSYPAQVFMGDTGSLALGGVIAVLSLMVKKELLIPIMCGVFMIETLSVMIQVSYFKYTKRKTGEGKRIFKMAPLHHHFELSGLHESKIVTRFWIVAVMLAVLAFATLKLR